MKLHEESSSQDLYMKKIADQMFVKFNKYWSEFNVLFAITVIFDPRYKFQFVEFSYGKLYGYGSQELMKVRGILDKYHSSMSPQVVEALICRRDWLFGENDISPVKLEDVSQNIMALDLNKGEAKSSLMEGANLNIG
ncbi:hypothetical protein ZIOFF_013626 [Zingiber officinale]|uniref:hAT-like transposase RNase-H fold domain-containing protein n=1 Tax=Zingiber officinale TaxID=94328 RepID=A0A8J5HS50_ZINOF|nr:hypothetical protein ZIOFF_013626 [Zingiber officinale]